MTITRPSQLSAREAFKRIMRGHNPLTPNVLRYGWHGTRLCYELSEGEGIRTQPHAEPGMIYGVTVVEVGSDPQLPGVNRYDLSRAFPTQVEAEAYILDGFVTREVEDALADLQEQAEREGWA